MATTSQADPTFVRRPEVPRLAEKLSRQHPNWSRQRCLIEAKLIVTNKPRKP